MDQPLIACSTMELNFAARQYLLENGVEVFVVTATEIIYSVQDKVQADLRDVAGSVAITSQHAVKSIFLNTDGKLPKATELFCLAGRTQTAALKLNIPIRATAVNAASLATEIIKSGTDAVTFICSDRHRLEMPEKLEQSGIAVRRLVVYSTRLTPPRVDRHFDFVLFFSPGAVEAFLQNTTLPSHVVCFCLGETTAKFLRERSVPSIIATFPSQEHLVQTLVGYVNSKTRRIVADVSL